ncbi:magnesium chelatase subunit H [Chroococcidiopsis sp. FACHB-1243]|uniref:magnesium chelatase subunit H n=1 Tax=Chroococcidiopsis sp. [FACHB-1243] TaxID=2692781 RepID=UPI00177D73E4|nr:magnesium chelatase subunit H [Chroococcidiopsis sp. [FACHB-1243]]MBD2307621.1 magnesium chelatase subunit H [Chroococcidiopsis sp. [FACHB-1243]]
MKRIVLIAGFESFNADLYRQAADLARSRCPELEICVFSDRDISTKPTEIEAALDNADVFFGSLLFDYDQVLWLRDRLSAIPIRLVFESALELMSLTKLGAFAIGDKPKGMPKPVKFILDKFSQGREEDRLAGYISFLKVGPKLLKYVPVQKVQDLRNWLIIYGYWNAGGSDNVAALFWTLAEKYLGLKIGDIPLPIETPNMGLLHPDYQGFFTSPREYINWYQKCRDVTCNVSTQPIVGILLYRKHVITKQPYIPQLIRYFERAGLIPLPIFINGVEGHVAVRDWMTTTYETAQRQLGNVETPSLSSEAVTVDAIVSTIGFPLVGGPAGSMEAGRQVEVATRILSAKNVPYIVAAPLLIQDIHSWTRQGIGGLQSVVLYALPELDGAIDTVPLGGLVGEKIYLIPERVQRLVARLQKWIALRQKPAAERKIAIILYGFPPGYGATGTAALLNVPRSLLKFLQALKDRGYTVGDLPEDGEELIRWVKAADEEIVSRKDAKPPREKEGKLCAFASLREIKSQVMIPTQRLEKWLGYLQTSRIEKHWKSLSGSGIKTYGDELLVGGVQLGNVWIGVQPPLGIPGDPMRLMFDRDLTPHPQYAAYYKWLQQEFQADAVIHFGMHGTVEWLPGSPLGNTGYSWSDILLGNLPNLYIYAANNPSESILAKRRGYGTIISHNVPPYGRAGLYKELVALRDLIAEYREDPEKNYALKEAICKKIVDAGINTDCPLAEAKHLGIAFTPENARLFSKVVFDRYLLQVYEYLQVLENRLFSSGLHVLGEPPSGEQLASYLQAYFGEELSADVVDAIANGKIVGAGLAQDSQLRQEISPQNPPVNTIANGKIVGAGLAKNSQLRQEISVQNPPVNAIAQLEEALQIRDLLMQTDEELINLLRGLNGEYIPPAPGGDLLRDGMGVLPTGRNIHALDPYRMPSPAAYERGKAIAQNIISQHLQEHGEYPETVAVMLWGLDAIKTRGESLGILLELVGAEPIKEGTGRIVRYGLKPLAQVGHPRIDVLGNLSGIFRDSFVNIIELLDDLFQRAAMAEESETENFIRKHYLALQAQGVENPSARLFSNPAGDFGSMVNERVTDGNWESGDELGNTWRDRNVFSYGRQDKGRARPEVLTQLLQKCDRIVQEIDSVEYGLTDIQEYYANTGGLKKAAEKQRGKKVTASFVESFSQDTTPRNLDDLLRMEYRTKLLNPKWAEAMVNQGSGGAFEISQRMTALIGWGGTADFTDDWVYDQAADTYVLDAEMAEKLRKANPEAFRNIVGRAIEAHGRGFWNADPEKLEKLRQMYEMTENELEGVKI